MQTERGGYYSAKKEKYYDKVIELYQKGYGSRIIPKSVPVCKQIVVNWIAIFAEQNKSIVKMKSSKSSQLPPAQAPQDVKLLQKRIKELEAPLKHASLRADFYDEMINVAEAKFNIPIRKNWRQTVMNLHTRAPKKYTITGLCELFGRTKQAYHKYDENSVRTKVAQEEFIIQYIHEVRERDRGIGGTKLWHMYKNKFGKNNPVGRDRFEDIVISMDSRCVRS